MSALGSSSALELPPSVRMADMDAMARTFGCSEPLE